MLIREGLWLQAKKEAMKRVLKKLRLRAGQIEKVMERIKSSKDEESGLYTLRLEMKVRPFARPTPQSEGGSDCAAPLRRRPMRSTSRANPAFVRTASTRRSSTC